MTTLLLRDAEWVVTLDEKRRLLRNASVFISDGKIVSVEKAGGSASREKADEVIDCRRKVVAPGFVNAHMHVSYGHAVRGLLPASTPREEYLAAIFRIQSLMTPREEYLTSLLAMAELVRGGCTTFLDPGSSSSLQSLVSALRLSGMRAVVGSHVIDAPNPLNLKVTGTDEALRTTESVLRRFGSRRGGRVTGWAMLFSPGYCTEELLVETKRLAKDYGSGLTLHASENPATVAAFKRQRGMKPVEYLSRRGVLDKNTLLAHAVAADMKEVGMLAKAGACVAYCPSAAGSSAARMPLVPEMLQRGVCVGLGSDSASSSYYLDPVRVMYLASVLFRKARHAGSALPPETTLEMATVNGARALGVERFCGSIEAGKDADIVVFDASGGAWRSLFYPVNNLVYAADSSSVETVIVNGRVAVRDGNVMFVDESELGAQVQRIAEKLLRRSGFAFHYRWPETRKSLK